MRDSWIGLQAGVDARRWARVLRRAHDVALHEGHVPSIVRGVIADSWERCAETGVDPSEPGAPQVIAPDDAAERFRDHPLSQTTDVLRATLGALLYEARHILVVSDADGCLLWSEGHPDVLSASEEIRFTPGYAWSELAAGTNAVGTALAADHAVQVFSAEHFRSEVHGWQCSGAPIHDPETGELLGAIDVTGRFETASPHTLALVALAGRLVEERLRAQMLERDARILGRFAESAPLHRAGPAAALSPSGRVLAVTDGLGPLAPGHRVAIPPAGDRIVLADGTQAAIEPLGEGAMLVGSSRRPGDGVAPGGAHRRARRAGAHRLTVRPGGRASFFTPTAEHRLTIRHSQIAELLARHPEGLDARALSDLLYGAPGHEVAVRAELHRMRDILGDCLGTRPYRLEGVATEINRPAGG
ncbi:MAG TPA: GAF domain-containing protein [Solirubrobacteraceae bacterium]|nr:GAF domain-containing protein [Solirubrobacteraceae bacterium]